MSVRSVDSGKDGFTVVLSSGRTIKIALADLPANVKTGATKGAETYLSQQLDTAKALDSDGWFFLPVVRSVDPLIVDLYDGPKPFTHGLQH